MPIQGNVSARISQSSSSIERAKSKDGLGCDDSPCTDGRIRTSRYRATSLGQEAIASDLFIKNKQESARYFLYVFMVRLLGMYGSVS